MTRISSWLAICLLYANVVSGDIAPIKYEGYSLSVKENSDIRMKSERIHIYWGQRCRVDAEFEMQNEANRPVDVFVGFPVRDLQLGNRTVYDFQVCINGESKPEKVQRVQEKSRFGGLTWFGWDQTFPPGTTIIQVKYHIEPSGSYNQPWQNVYYVLETGKCWKDAIGQASVTVHFETPVAGEQIRDQTAPAGFHIEGNNVSWHFTDLEPTSRDDIRLEYMPSAIYQMLQRLRRGIEANPADEARIVELARHYFDLGPYKGVGAYWPTELTPAQFESLVARIADPNDRAAFRNTYRQTAKRVAQPTAHDETGRVIAVKMIEETVFEFRGQSQQTGVSSDRIVHILNAIDYTPYELSEYVIRARGLLEQLLEKNPRNANAWMAYLSNYYRFKFGGFAPQTHLAWLPMSAAQKEVAKRAYACCPTHEGVRLWYEFAMSETANATELPDMIHDYDPARDVRFVRGNERDPLVKLWNYCAYAGVYKVRRD